MTCLSLHSDIEFTTDHPMLGLQRVHSTMSDSSDCTLPVASVNMDIYYLSASPDEEGHSGKILCVHRLFLGAEHGF
jgi:hypothetical protein